MKTFKVKYFTGGYMNRTTRELYYLYSEEQAAKEVAELNRMGYYAWMEEVENKKAA